MHQPGQAYTEHYDELIDCIDRMVQIISVYRPLTVADAGQCPVQGIAIPVYHKTERTQPQPVDIARGQDISCCYHNRSECTDICQYIRCHPARLTLRQPYKHLLLCRIEDRSLYPHSIRFVSVHNNLISVHKPYV